MESYIQGSAVDQALVLHCSFINFDLTKSNFLDELELSEDQMDWFNNNVMPTFDIGDNCGLQSMFPSYQTVEVKQIFEAEKE